MDEATTVDAGHDTVAVADKEVAAGTLVEMVGEGPGDEEVVGVQVVAFCVPGDRVDSW